MKNKKFIIILIIITITIFSFSFVDTKGYKKVSSSVAMQMMENEKKYVLLDVRSFEEYKEGHIKNAISFPLQNIKGEIKELPNKNELIFVYCRSGNRSREAALRLIKLGYTNVIDIGGINTWNGEIVK